MIFAGTAKRKNTGRRQKDISRLLREKKQNFANKLKTAKRKKPKMAAGPKHRRGKMAETKAKEIKIGEVTHFFSHVNAAIIKLKQPLKIGDKVRIKGHTTDFTEQVDSMEIDHKPVNEAKKGDEIGLLVKDKARGGDLVYKIE